MVQTAIEYVYWCSKHDGLSELNSSAQGMACPECGEDMQLSGTIESVLSKVDIIIKS